MSQYFIRDSRRYDNMVKILNKCRKSESRNGRNAVLNVRFFVEGES